MNVLIAEDNHLNQQLMALFMKRFGWRYTIVSDGFGAVDACKAGTFDIVLMDVDMPGMDGIEATGCIRTFDGTTPIVAVTAFTDEVTRGRCYEAGMDRFLSKPIAKDQIVAVISDLVPSKLEQNDEVRVA
ncbi:MAG TPA: response regulator [Bacteroidales bacterium]|nr:response regulator [Bacteroidales bacterium]